MPGPPSARSEPRSPQFPQVFGKYVLLRPMAKGGMGELFLAAAGEVGGFEKLSVVKKVLPDLDDPGVRRRFLDEAKVVVRLNHANLVQVFDAGIVGDENYLAMELVEGKDLRAVWNRCAQLHRRIPVEFAIFAIREVCRGLDYVHDAMGLDLVHRDISPPNILVSYHGQVKITDFGLAKHAIKRELTNPGVVFGRYSYLSPEQARGLPADRRTDIYAAGIILWEMLTGRQLFPADHRGGQGPSLSVLRKPKIPAPSSIVPGIPEGLDAVVLKALAVEREDRYQTAGAFRAALSEILARFAPTTDVDHVSEFMRDIFQRERKLEMTDYASYAREDFSRIRAEVPQASTRSVSISEALAKGEEVALGEDDIVELEQVDRRWEEAPDDATLAAAARDRVGEVVARRYRVERLLGIGGMGAVYEVTHLALGKHYALKVLHKVYGRDPDLIDRFMREARAATQTGHPNIIDVVDIGTMEDGDLFFVMELLDGVNLGRVVQQEGRLGIKRAVHIARQICKAVSAAHEAGIIHRDLKSDNVVLTTRDGDGDFVKVLDFGICKQVDGGDSARTTPGMVMGSPDYMAPEQAAGAEATAASDVYAVGTILYQMLVGELPFTGRNAIDVLMQKGARPAPRVDEHRNDVPPALVAVVARCLEREPEARYGTMKALEYELTRAMEGRASAVAAAMGLKLPGAGPAASSSGQSAAAAEGEAVELHPAEGADAQLAAEVYTVHQQAAASQSSAQAAARSHAGMSRAEGDGASSTTVGRPVLGGGLKALLFVGLGVALAGGLFFAFGPEWAASPGSDSEAGADGSARVDAGSTGSGDGTSGAGSGRAAGATTGALAVADGEPGAVEELESDTEGPEEAVAGVGAAVAEAGGAEATDDPEALVVMAEAALAEEHWREPAAGSLALALTKLALVDPGHEAISRLRREAEKVLEPRARKAAKRKKWAEAAAAYRDLLAVWPDHEAREELITALRSQGRILRRYDDHEGALASADEVLVMEPRSFVALKLRADSLASLERWEEAVPAYRAAMRVKPNNKDVRKGYWRARGKLKKEGEAD